jgi:hypothetical protein
MSASSDPTPLEPLRDAYLFMNGVTGIPARISSFEIPLYKNKRHYHEDIERWQDWYYETKCWMTNERADSLVRVYSYGFSK